MSPTVDGSKIKVSVDLILLGKNNLTAHTAGKGYPENLLK